MSPGMPGAPRSWKRWEGPSPAASGGSSAQGHLDLRHVVPRMGEDGCLWSQAPGKGTALSSKCFLPKEHRLKSRTDQEGKSNPIAN